MRVPDNLLNVEDSLSGPKAWPKADSVIYIIVSTRRKCFVWYMLRDTYRILYNGTPTEAALKSVIELLVKADLEEVIVSHFANTTPAHNRPDLRSCKKHLGMKMKID